MTSRTPIRKSVRVSATVLTAIALLFTAMMTYILLVPVDGNDFESVTDQSWDLFSAANPQAADYLTREARLLAMGFLGLCLLVAVLSWTRLRDGDSEVASPLLVFPFTILGASVVFLASGGPVLGVTYLIVGMTALGCIAIATRGMRAN